MAYEYEDELLNYASDSESYEKYEDMLNEIKNVYAKAKAFDEIVGLRNNHYIYSKTNSGTPITVLDAKTFGREVSHLINKNGYTEDK